MSVERQPWIAIVDDDPSVCRALGRLARSDGMRAETFASGEDFLQRLAAHPEDSPGCLILDLQMPQLDGLAVQRRLAEAGRRIATVFITAHDQSGAREAALGAGAVAFLSKPVDDTVLIRALHEALAGHAAEAE